MPIVTIYQGASGSGQTLAEALADKVEKLVLNLPAVSRVTTDL